MNVDLSSPTKEAKQLNVTKSAYSTLKVRTFIMLNMFHNSIRKREMSSTVLKVPMLLLGTYRTFKCVLQKRVKPFIIAYINSKVIFVEDKKVFYHTIMIGFLALRRSSIEFIYSIFFGYADESEKYVCFISTSN